MNELVTSDDDTTAELEVLVLPTLDPEVESEAAAHTAGIQYEREPPEGAFPSVAILELQADLKSRSETINRLEYDIEQLRSRWRGLEAENEARQALSETQNAELQSLRDALKRKNDLLKKRDRKIKLLKAEIRERNDAYVELSDDVHMLQTNAVLDGDDDAADGERRVARLSGQLASKIVRIKELEKRLTDSERYADELRQKLQERDRTEFEEEHTAAYLQRVFDDAQQRIASLEASIADAQRKNESLSTEMAALHTTHADEIRMIRFELGQAQETVSQHEIINEQLASDLVETRTFRMQLENQLNQATEHSNARVESLQRKNSELQREIERMQQKIDTKSEAINCLLSELANKTKQLESIGAIEDVIHDIDERMADRADGPEASSIEKDRITRVLIGNVDGQELRFPLFKDRLTIGRTQQNDIQLKASHISRRHAVIVTEADATRVIDWGSKNGVYVNTRRITEHFLKNGDVVTVGTAEFRYEERPKRES